MKRPKKLKKSEQVTRIYSRSHRVDVPAEYYVVYHDSGIPALALEVTLARVRAFDLWASGVGWAQDVDNLTRPLVHGPCEYRSTDMLDWYAKQFTESL